MHHQTLLKELVAPNTKMKQDYLLQERVWLILFINPFTAGMKLSLYSLAHLKQQHTNPLSHLDKQMIDKIHAVIVSLSVPQVAWQHSLAPSYRDLGHS